MFSLDSVLFCCYVMFSLDSVLFCCYVMFSLIRLDYIQHLHHREEEERHLGQDRYCPYLSSLHLQLYISISSTACVFTVWNVKHMSCLLLLFNSSVEITLEEK